MSKEGETHPMILPAPNCNQIFIIPKMILWYVDEVQ